MSTVVVVIWTVYACLVHHVVIEVVQLVHEILVSIKDCLLCLIKFLEVFLHLQMSVEVLQSLSNDTNQLHLMEQNCIQVAYILLNV
mgnify:CR=1 FL=1